MVLIAQRNLTFGQGVTFARVFEVHARTVIITTTSFVKLLALGLSFCSGQSMRTAVRTVKRGKFANDSDLHCSRYVFVLFY